MGRGQAEDSRTRAITRQAARGLLFGTRREPEARTDLRYLFSLPDDERSGRCPEPEQQLSLIKDCRQAIDKDQHTHGEMVALLDDVLAPQIQPLLDEASNLDHDRLRRSYREIQDQWQRGLAGWEEDRPLVEQALLQQLGKTWPEPQRLLESPLDDRSLEELSQNLISEPASLERLEHGHLNNTQELCRRLLLKEGSPDLQQATRELRSYEAERLLKHINREIGPRLQPFGLERRQIRTTLESLNQEVPDFKADGDKAYLDSRLIEQARPYAELDNLLLQLQLKSGIYGPNFWSSVEIAGSYQREQMEKNIARALRSPLPWNNITSDLDKNPPSIDDQLHPFRSSLDEQLPPVRNLAHLLARSSGYSEREAMGLVDRGLRGIAALRHACPKDNYELVCREALRRNP